MKQCGYCRAGRNEQHESTCPAFPRSTGTSVKSPVVAILEECIKLHNDKSSDYDHPTEHDGLGNFRRSERIGVTPFIGALTRMMDKWSRLETLTMKMQQGQGAAVKNETFEDTLMDNLVYSAIVLALYREWKQSGTTVDTGVRAMNTKTIPHEFRSDPAFPDHCRVLLGTDREPCHAIREAHVSWVG